MKKNEVIHTPHGPAKVLRFTMMKNFRSGVEMRVIETGEVRNEFRFTVDNWQREAVTHERT